MKSYQCMFSNFEKKLSGELQRRIGLKVLDMSGNCVLGYIQNFDLEGEHGIVVRGIGTVAFIYKSNSSSSAPNSATVASNGLTHFAQSTPASASLHSNPSTAKLFNFNGSNTTTATTSNATIVPFFKE